MGQAKRWRDLCTAAQKHSACSAGRMLLTTFQKFFRQTWRKPKKNSTEAVNKLKKKKKKCKSDKELPAMVLTKLRCVLNITELKGSI